MWFWLFKVVWRCCCSGKLNYSFIWLIMVLCYFQTCIFLLCIEALFPYYLKCTWLVIWVSFITFHSRIYILILPLNSLLVLRVFLCFYVRTVCLISLKWNIPLFCITILGCLGYMLIDCTWVITSYYFTLFRLKGCVLLIIHFVTIIFLVN